MNRSLLLKLGLLFLLLVGIGLILHAIGIDLSRLSPDRVRAFVVSFGVWAPAIYLLIYGQPLVPLPASIMTITGGLAFGPAWGTAAAIAGATVRACGQFLIAKLLGQGAVEKLLKGRLARLNERAGQNGFKTVLLVRLIPNIPYDMQNYGLGFSQVRFPAFALGTVLGIFPGCFAFVYLGYSLTDPTQLWKLALAILIIVGLMVTQRRWSAKRKSAIPMIAEKSAMPSK